MQNQKLSEMLRKMDASRGQQSSEDQFVNINEELAKNIRAVYGAGNGSCSGNDSCDNNGTCQNNGTCNGNGTCNQPIKTIDPIAD